MEERRVQEKIEVTSHKNNACDVIVHDNISPKTLLNVTFMTKYLH